MTDSRNSDRGRSERGSDCTRVIPFCDECPPLSDWPRKNLTLGTCPKCHRYDWNSWREAMARRLVEARNA